jgi:hypothetical protein
MSQWTSHTMGYSVLERSEILMHTSWINLENTV